ncbi:MAG TPA: hypothetical protein VKA34_08195 [Balneolales bacterium]|nr:hypothetical protein [Balneolales bacterium]
MNQKLHLLVSNDPVRPVMSNALLTKDNIVVSNFFALVAHSTKEVFSEEFIASIPDGEWLVPEIALKSMSVNKSTYFIENGVLNITKKTGQKESYKLLPNGGNAGKYPPFEYVLPIDPEEYKLAHIGINPKLLSNLQDAIDPYSSGVALYFIGEKNNAIIVKTLGSSLKEYKAIIMQVQFEY